MLPATLLLVATVLVGCAAAWPNRLPSKAPLSIEIAHFADSTVATLICGHAGWRAAQKVTSCDYTGTKDGQSISIPSGFTTKVAFVGEEGDSASYSVTAYGYKPGLTPTQLASRPGTSASFKLGIAVQVPTAPDTLIVTWN